MCVFVDGDGRNVEDLWKSREAIRLVVVVEAVEDLDCNKSASSERVVEVTCLSWVEWECRQKGCWCGEGRPCRREKWPGTTLSLTESRRRGKERVGEVESSSNASANVPQTGANVRAVRVETVRVK